MRSYNQNVCIPKKKIWFHFWIYSVNSLRQKPTLSLVHSSTLIVLWISIKWRWSSLKLKKYIFKENISSNTFTLQIIKYQKRIFLQSTFHILFFFEAVTTAWHFVVVHSSTGIEACLWQELCLVNCYIPSTQDSAQYIAGTKSVFLNE